MASAVMGLAPAPQPSQARTIPKEIEDKYSSWRHWSTFWRWTNSAMGLSTAFLTTVIAANAKPHYFAPRYVAMMSIGAAMLAFLVASLNADSKAKGFAVAAREVEVAMTRYQFDSNLKEVFLSDAVVRGIGILNMFDSKKST